MGNKVERECPICGTVYLADIARLEHGRETTCSRKCSYTLRAQNMQTRIETTCERCGKVFYTTPYKLAHGHDKYCSKECHHPPRYEVCRHCGKEFRCSPSAGGLFCSKQCADASEQKSERARQILNERWQDPVERQRLLDAIALRSESEEWRSAPHFQKGEKHPRYKGNRQKRDGVSRYRYKQWHRDVLRQDNFTCQICGKRGGFLQAHHIKPWAEYPDLRYDLSNGMTVCPDCHNKIHGLNKRHRYEYCQDCGVKTKDLRSRYCRSCAAKRGNKKRRQK